MLESLGEAPVHEHHVQLAHQVYGQAHDERSVQAREAGDTEPRRQVARGRVLVVGCCPQLSAVVALPFDAILAAKVGI
jgi:hypothetical protein